MSAGDLAAGDVGRDAAAGSGWPPSSTHRSRIATSGGDATGSDRTGDSGCVGVGHFIAFARASRFARIFVSYQSAVSSSGVTVSSGSNSTSTGSGTFLCLQFLDDFLRGTGRAVLRLDRDHADGMLVVRAQRR